MGFWSKLRGALSRSTAQDDRTEVSASEDNGAVSVEAEPLLPPPAGDEAVSSREEDQLGRKALAEAIAAQIAGAYPESGVVFGVTGPWGSGKTSLLGMAKEALEQDHHGFLVLWLNPWFFTGTEHLMGIFFTELGAQLSDLSGSEWDELGSSLQIFGTALSKLRAVPTVGGATAAGGENMSGVGRRMRGSADEGASLYERRKRLEDALKKAGEKNRRRLIIVVDDLDRLRRQEIRDLVALVKLNADLPNLHFILAYDRERVEHALGEVEGNGRAYLDKIVQVVHDVPEAREIDVKLALVEAVSEVTDAAAEIGPYEPDRVSEVLKELVFPLVGSIRGVKRYANALPVTLRATGDEVALADVLGLEAIRLFMPGEYSKLSAAAGALTTPTDTYIVSSHKERDKQAVEEFLDIEEATGKRELVEKMCELLFPASLALHRNNHYGSVQDDQAARERRVASWRFLRFFIDKRLPQDVLPARKVQEVFEAFDSPSRLQTLLEAEDLQSLHRLLIRLQEYEDTFQPREVMEAIPVISNQHAHLMSEAGRSTSFGSDFSYGGLMARMLDKWQDPSQLAYQLKIILPRIDSLSASLELVTIVGHRPNTGEGLVSEEDAKWFEEHMVTALENASEESLATEYGLARLLIRARQHDEERGERLISRLAEDDGVFLAALLSYHNRSNTGVEDGDMQDRQTTLRWKDFCSLFGEDTARRRVDELREKHDPPDLDAPTAEALKLAHLHATGRPPTWTESE